MGHVLGTLIAICPCASPYKVPGGISHVHIHTHTCTCTSVPQIMDLFKHKYMNHLIAL